MSSRHSTGLARIRQGWPADTGDWKPHLRPGADRSSDTPPAAGLAQLVEHLICNQRVGSSSLSTGTTGNKDLWVSGAVCKGRFFRWGNVRRFYQACMSDRRGKLGLIDDDKTNETALSYPAPMQELDACPAKTRQVVCSHQTAMKSGLSLAL